MHLLMLLFTPMYFSDSSGSNRFFLSSLPLSHRSRTSAVTQGVFFFFRRCLPRTVRGHTNSWRLDHCETRKSYYCPRSSRKIPHRRARDAEPIDRIPLSAVQLQGQWWSISTGMPPDRHREWPPHPSLGSGSWRKGSRLESTIFQQNWSKHTALTTICYKIWQTGEWPAPLAQSLVITLPKKGNLQ